MSETYQPLVPGVPLTVAVVVRGALAAKLAVIVWLAVMFVKVSGLSVVADKAVVAGPVHKPVAAVRDCGDGGGVAEDVTVWGRSAV